MTINQINEILTGTFENEADRKYWEQKRAELIRKESNSVESEEYYKANVRYNR